MSFSYDKFLRPLSSTDTNIQILNNSAVVVYTVNPFAVSSPMISNNLLKINFRNGKVITINFSTTSEAKLALSRFQVQLDQLLSKTPLIIDKQIKNYIDSVIVEGGSNGTSGTSGETGQSGSSGTSGVDGTFFGSSGTSGVNGNIGNDGSSGTSGVDGNDGSSGTSGVDGTSGTSGSSGSSGTSGLMGSIYSATSSTTIVVQDVGHVINFNTQQDLAYTSGQQVLMYSELPNLYVDEDYVESYGNIIGEVDSYNSLTGSMSIVVNYSESVGNTYSFWYINLTGESGSSGLSGTSGTSGTSGDTGSSGIDGVSNTTLQISGGSPTLSGGNTIVFNDDAGISLQDVRSVESYDTDLEDVVFSARFADYIDPSCSVSFGIIDSSNNFQHYGDFAYDSPGYIAGNFYANGGVSVGPGYTFTLNDLVRIKVSDTKVYFYKNSLLLGSQSTTPHSYKARFVSGSMDAGQTITIDKVTLYGTGKSGTSGTSGSSGTSGKSGSGFIWNGSWNPSGSYISGVDVVLDTDGSSYIKIGGDGNSGSNPSQDPIRWSLFTQAGTSGTSGSSGSSGTSGSSGSSGSNGGNGYAVSKYYYYANTGNTTGQFDVIGTANFNTITGLYVNSTDYDGFQMGSYLQGILNSGETLEVQIKKITDPTKFGIYRLNTATYSGGKLSATSLTTLASSSSALESGINYHLSFSTTIPTTTLSLSGNLSVNGTASFNGLTLLQEVTEVINATPGATASTVVYDFTTGSNWYHSSATTNYTANFTNIPTDNNRAITATIIINQGATAYIPTVVQINGVGQTIKWAGGTASGTENQVDIVGFTFIRSGGAWAQVLGQINTFD